MEVQVQKIPFNPDEYGWRIKEYLIKYLNEYNMLNDENRKKLENISFCAENLLERSEKGAKMVNRSWKNEIAVDFLFFDDDKENLKLKQGYETITFSQLIHEMLHQVSAYDRGTGIMGIDGGSNKHEALNEGFTQMITERITGFTVSKDGDGYTDHKKIAKIISDSVGEDIVYESYFRHNHSLMNILNSLTRDGNFYENLNGQMSIMQRKKLAPELYDETKNLLIKKMCASVIIPKLETLPDRQKGSYLAKIYDDLKDDEVFLGQVKHCLEKYGQLSSQELTAKRNEIESKLKEKQELNDALTLNGQKYYDNKPDELIGLIYPAISFNPNTAEIQVNGNITFNITNKTTNEEKVYSLDKKQIENIIKNSKFIREGLYKKEYLSKFSKMKETEIDEKAKSLAQQGTCGCFGFKGKSYLGRYCMFSTVSSKLEENGVVILDNIDDCIKKESVTPNFVVLPRENEQYDFENLKKIYDNLSVQQVNDPALGKITKVFYKNNGQEIHNKKVIEAARFADTWVRSFSRVNNSPFGSEAKSIYDDLIKCTIEQAKRTAKTDYNEIYNKMGNNGISGLIKRSLFSDPQNLSDIRRFIKQMQPGILQVENPKTLGEHNKVMESDGFTKEEIDRRLSYNQTRTTAEQNGKKRSGNEKKGELQINNERIKNGEEMTDRELAEFARRMNNAYKTLETTAIQSSRIFNEEAYMNMVSRAIKGEFDNDPQQMKISKEKGNFRDINGRPTEGDFSTESIERMCQYLAAAKNMYIPGRKDRYGREISPIREFYTIPYIRTALTEMSKSSAVNEFLAQAQQYQNANTTRARAINGVNLGLTPAEKDRETAIKYLEQFPEGNARDMQISEADINSHINLFQNKAKATLAKILNMHDNPSSQRNYVKKLDNGSYILSDTPERQNNQNQQLVKGDKKIKCKDVQKDLVIGGVNITEVKRVLGEFGQNIKGAIQGNSRDDENRNR